MAFTGLITPVPGKSRSPGASAAVFRPPGSRQQKTLSLLLCRWDPDGITFPLFIDTIPRKSPDVSHLGALTASRGPLAPRTVRFLGLFYDSGPGFMLAVRLKSDI